MTTILFQSYDQVLSARKLQASCAGEGERSVLGVRFATPRSLFADSWQLWGDGRRLVSARERLALVLGILEKQQVFTSTVGTSQLISGFLERYAGCEQLDAALGGACPTSLSAAEGRLLQVVSSYFDSLEDRGLVEEGCALAFLRDAMPAEDVRMAVPGDLTPAQVSFLEGTGCAARRLDEVSVAPLEAGVELGLLFPAGATAVEAAIYDEAVSFAKSAGASASLSIAVCASDPRGLYEALAPYLADAGVSCGLRCRVAFTETSFGRAWAAVGVLATGVGDWQSAATDFAFSKFSGLRRFEAQRLNTRLRRNRLSTCEDACAYLRQASRAFPLFEDLVAKGSAEVLDRLDSFAEEGGLYSSACGAVERDMVDAYRAMLAELSALGSSREVARSLAQTLSVSVSWLARPTSTGGEDAKDVGGAGGSAADEGPCVVIVPAGDMAYLAQGAYDEVILADVSDAALHAQDPTALDAFARKLGIEGAPSSLGASRNAFLVAERAARRRFVCVMPLRNASQEDAYASFPFEEFLEAQARAVSASGSGGCGAEFEELPDTCGARKLGTVVVPAELSSSVRRYGEDGLLAGIGRTFVHPRGTLALEPVSRGRLGRLRLSDHMRTVREEAGVVAVLSPSALESYVACPYKWFVERRLCLHELDEGFTAVEKGSFVHAVHAAYYDELASRGLRRIPLDAEGRKAAFELFDCVFDACVAKQATREPGGGRLVAANKNESLQVESLRELLRICLARQARLPQGYNVREHELTLSPDDGIDYAGARINGRVDRVDVNEETDCFVVLDYKGSIAGHAAGFDADADVVGFSLPRKTQALVYAQALRKRCGGMRCAGALYLSYRAKADGEFAAGSFDESAYDASAFAKDSSRVDMNFERYLDLVEQTCEPYVASLVAGVIEADPSDKDACAYCPVSSCERRA